MDSLKRSSPHFSRVFCPGGGFSKSISVLYSNDRFFTKTSVLRAGVLKFLLLHGPPSKARKPWQQAQSSLGSALVVNVWLTRQAVATPTHYSILILCRVGGTKAGTRNYQRNQNSGTMEIARLCGPSRIAAVKFSPETVRRSRDGKFRDIVTSLVKNNAVPLSSGNEAPKLPRIFSRPISRHISPDTLQLQRRDFIEFFHSLQAFVRDIAGDGTDRSVWQQHAARIILWACFCNSKWNLQPQHAPYVSKSIDNFKELCMENGTLAKWWLWTSWLRADFREGDEDSNFSISRVRRFTESPRPLHWIAFPVEFLTKPPIHWIASPLFTEKPFFSLKSASSHPFPKIGSDWSCKSCSSFGGYIQTPCGHARWSNGFVQSISCNVRARAGL